MFTETEFSLQSMSFNIVLSNLNPIRDSLPFSYMIHFNTTPTTRHFSKGSLPLRFPGDISSAQYMAF